MSIAIDSNTLVACKVIVTKDSTPITNMGYVDVPVGQLIEGGSTPAVAANQADSTATDVTGVVADFNALLAKLIAAGLMAAA